MHDAIVCESNAQLKLWNDHQFIFHGLNLWSKIHDDTLLWKNLLTKLIYFVLQYKSRVKMEVVRDGHSFVTFLYQIWVNLVRLLLRFCDVTLGWYMRYSFERFLENFNGNFCDTNENICGWLSCDTFVTFKKHLKTLTYVSPTQFHFSSNPWFVSPFQRSYHHDSWSRSSDRWCLSPGSGLMCAEEITNTFLTSKSLTSFVTTVKLGYN